jgi:cystathionine beta-lyase family protein involved in aluminum resistance
MMKNLFNINKKIIEVSEVAINKIKSQLNTADKITETNQQRMLKAFIDNKVSESHFTATTGYGYSDRGRETLGKVYADAFFAEDAIVSHSFASGTHAIAVALFGILRPGNKMLCVTGTPYDTLLGVIGINKAGSGSLLDFNISYEQIDLMKNGMINYNEVQKRLTKEKVKMVFMQRSRGYSDRPSLFISDIEKVVKIVKNISPDTIIMVDNCYGEFVEDREPTFVGADLMAGSLIKNSGGGIAPTGGYIAGRKDLVDMCACRLTTPSTGSEIGASLGFNRELFMGAFNAPHVTGEALKTAIFAAAFFEELLFDVSPKSDDKRADIIQSIRLNNEKAIVAFCEGIQKGAPVDSFVAPRPWDMPGYDCKVIMAAGAFINGASIELSADAPIREPYLVYLQGGLNFHSAKQGIMLAAQSMYEAGEIKL